MAQLISMEEAAAMLGVSVDELNQIRERRDLFGIRDGGSWKFKKADVEAYRERFSGSPSGVGSGVYNMPVSLDDPDKKEGSDLVLLSEEALGESAGTSSSTVIGKGAGKDSDLKITSEPGPSSDLKLGGSSGNLKRSGSDMELVDLGSDDDALPLDLGSSKVGPGSSKRAMGSSPTVELRAGGSDLTLDSGLTLGGGSDLKLAPDSSIGSEKGTGKSSSTKMLKDSKTVFEDDDLVLGTGSGTGSSLGDSGINLVKANDSGLSLEEPLALGSEIGRKGSSGDDDSSELQELSSDDDFLLTPMLELDDQESDSSGSQVIALDTEEPVDDQAPTLLGEDMQTMGQLQPEGLAMGAAQPVQQQMMMMAPAPIVAQERYGAGVIVGMVFLMLFVSLAGMMMFEMARNMWSWDTPYASNAFILDSFLSLFK